MKLRSDKADEAAKRLETVLLKLGHDPKNAAGGWRSTDPFVVALMFAASGYPVFPCSKLKTPLTKHGFHDATTDPATICSWDIHRTVYGWCVRTGRYDNEAGPAGLAIFDIDDALGYVRLAELERELGPLPITWTVMSGRIGGGEHRYFVPPDDGPDMKTVGGALINGKRGKIDQKGRGGYAVIAGSPHKSGNRYHWRDGCAPDEIPLASLPAVWVAAMDKAGDAAPKAITLRSGSSRTAPLVHVHDPVSLLIGDGPGFGGFHAAINGLAIRYFINAGPDAPAETLIAWLRKKIEAAPKDPGRDVTRYLSDEYLSDAVKSAQDFVRKINNAE